MRRVRSLFDFKFPEKKHLCSYIMNSQFSAKEEVFSVTQENEKWALLGDAEKLFRYLTEEERLSQN